MRGGGRTVGPPRGGGVESGRRGWRVRDSGAGMESEAEG